MLFGHHIAMDHDSAESVLDVAVLGGGAAGLLAGISAARAGARVVVYEKMATPGRKVAIAGGGRCNFTNTLNPREFVRRFGDKNAARLGHALRAFANEELIALLAKHGVEGQVEDGVRVFTRSGRGRDVVQALAAELQDAGGRLVCGARVAELTHAGVFVLEGRFGGCDERRQARTVIICTGGLSYPATGSTGDGYSFARALGHTVTPLRAALVGLTVDESWAAGLQGLSWPDAEVSLERSMGVSPMQHGRGHGAHGRDAHATKPLATERGEILFTHFGISGPAVLDLSNVFVASDSRRAQLGIDFFPALKRDELDRQVLARCRQFPNRTLANALEGLHQAPARLLEHWQAALGPDAAPLPVRQMPKQTRLQLLGFMKHTTLTVAGTRGLEFAEVTAGGVTWDEVDPKTLESRRCPGLFFAGEILDVAGRCGGFNLQAAFSAGFLAGKSAAARASAR